MKLLNFVSLKKLSFGIIIQYLMTVRSQAEIFALFSKLPEWTIQPIIYYSSLSFQFIPEHDADDPCAEFEIESEAYTGPLFFNELMLQLALASYCS